MLRETPDYCPYSPADPSPALKASSCRGSLCWRWVLSPPKHAEWSCLAPDFPPRPTCFQGLSTGPLLFLRKNPPKFLFHIKDLNIVPEENKIPHFCIKSKCSVLILHCCMHISRMLYKVSEATPALKAPVCWTATLSSHLSDLSQKLDLTEQHVLQGNDFAT